MTMVSLQGQLERDYSIESDFSFLAIEKPSSVFLFAILRPTPCLAGPLCADCIVFQSDL
jgi:hypothetical protein